MGRIAMTMAMAVAIGVAAACGDGETPRGGAESAPASSAARESAPAPRGVETGEFVVSLVGGRVQLASREAPRLAILRRLADLEGFTLDTSELPEARITLQLEEAPLGAALAALLDDVSYRSAFVYDAGLGRNRLASLVVGAAPAREGGGAGRGRGAGAGLRAGRLRLEGLPPGADEPDEEQQHWMQALGSANDRERREAIEQVDVDGPALARVIELATADSDPLVRAGAVGRLEESGTFAAIQGLLSVLEDPEPKVVLRAIEALEYAGDETVVPYLAPLYEHPDPKVRAAATEAGEFLGF